MSDNWDREYRDPDFGPTWEIARPEYDPTYGETSFSSVDVRTCKHCGAIVEEVERHREWHKAAE